MSVIKTEQQWLLYQESDTGMRSRIYDVVIPDDLKSSELATYLDDIYHEYSSTKHPHVVQLSE